MANKVTVSKAKHQNYKYRVSWTQAGKRRSKWFKLKGEAESEAAEIRGELAAKGADYASVTAAEFRAVQEFREAVASLPRHAQSVTLSDAVASYTASLKLRNKSVSCIEVADSLLLLLKKSGRGKRHRETIEQRINKFNVDYGDWMACDISTQIIDDFLINLKVAPKTQENYRLSLNLFFNHAIKLKASPLNPVAEAIRPTVKPCETGILEPFQVAKLLVNADKDTQPALAISFFAGVRRSEIERLDWSEINIEEGFIEIKAGKAKTAQRRLISISANLKEWLLPVSRQEGGVIKTPALYRKGFEAARIAADIDGWPSNAGRHSFASYHLAMHEDAGRLAMNLGHPDPRLLYSHYRKMVPKRIAVIYWNISPAKAESIIQQKTSE